MSSRIPAFLLLFALLAPACNNTAQPIRLPNVAPSVAITRPSLDADTDEAGPFEPEDGLVFEGRVTDTEDASAELEVAWSAQRTDMGDIPPVALGAGTPDSTGFVSRIITGLEPGRWIITLRAVDSGGASAEANLPIRILDTNFGPSVQISQPVGGSDHVEGTVLTFSGIVSDDRGVTELSVEWFSSLDGVLDASPPSTAGALAFSRSDLSVGQHTVTVRVTDSGALSAVDSVIFAVVPSNLPPTTPTVDVQPDPAFSGDDLQCLILVGSTDPDGLAVTHSYRWLRDGGNTAFTDSLLPASATEAGEVWTCSVTGSDGVLSGVAGTDEVLIENTVPEITSVLLGPAPAYENTVLTCAGVGWLDSDGDPEGYLVQWRVDGSVVSGATGMTLTGAHFSRGQQVECVLTPDDGIDTGVPMTSPAILIENTPPSAPLVTISPAPEAGLIDDLSCAASGSTDLDGDPVTMEVRWTRNGGAMPAYDGLTLIPNAVTTLGQVWSCEARGSDGSATSAWVSASTTVFPLPGDLVFSEFLADPGVVSDAAGEWVELYNASGFNLDLQGFELHDDGTDSHVIGSSLIIPAGARIVLTRNDDVATNGGVVAAYEYSGFVMDNGTDELVLSFMGMEVDRFNYTLSTWPGITGHSVSLDPVLGLPSAIANNDPWNWCGSMLPMTSVGSDFGTPGGANDNCLCFGSDGDGDGYGTDPACAFGDCNDANPAVNPAATDVCENAIDEDCSGSDALCSCASTDLDNDGYGTGAACWPVDCNDANTAINPGAAELCNGIDDNCTAGIDEGWDNDGDGYTTCNGDCNDGNPNVRPFAPELCNGIDDNCNGGIDEGWDNDGDGYTTCNGDCNDANSTIHPGALDVCDGINQDCDGSVDENAAGDWAEPNDTWNTARFIGGDDLIVDLWATFHLGSDNDDWYYITTVDDTDFICDLFYISVVLDSIPPGTDYDVYLYNGSLNLLGSSINVNNNSESIYWEAGCGSWGDDGGSYFIRVTRWSGFSCSDTYHLRVINQY